MIGYITRKIYTKTRSKLLNAVENIQHATGNSILTDAKGKRILLYHGIVQADNLRFNSRFITANDLEKYLIYYKSHFHIVSLEDYFTKEHPSDKFTIAITFDDGYANNYKFVLPLMKKYAVPATFFVTAIRSIGKDILWTDFFDLAKKNTNTPFTFMGNTYTKDWRNVYRSNKTKASLKSVLEHCGYMEKELMMDSFPNNFRNSPELEDYWTQLNEKQLREMGRSEYVTIGSHALYHNYLPNIPHNDAVQELAESKKYLETMTGKQIKFLAFPYGAYTRELLDDAEKLGFEYQLATDFLYPEDHSDPRLGERLTVNPYISFHNQLSAIVRGRYH